MALKGTAVPFYTYKQDDKVDFNLPEGMGGEVTKVYITYEKTEGVHITPPSFFIVYNEADREAPIDSFIKGKVQDAHVTYISHQPLAIRHIEVNANFRPHNGIKLRDVCSFYTERTEDGVGSYKIPYGIGGRVVPFIVLKLNKLAGYINDNTLESMACIALENESFPLRTLQSINDIAIDNNNTTNNKGG